MKGLLSVVGAILVAIICWGVFGPVLDAGQRAMAVDPSDGAGWIGLRPLICVGLSHSIVGLLLGGIMLYARGEPGRWTLFGVLWCFAAGTVAAVAALGTIVAFGLGGRPVYVMPLIFAGAPITAALTNLATARRIKQIGPAFLAGLIMVLLGSVTVLVFKPVPPPGAADVGLVSFVLILVAIAVAILCWGVFYSLAHRGQIWMGGSRLRPLILIGAAHLVVAVCVPITLLGVRGEPGRFTFGGTVWSLAAGTAGALGALAIGTAFRAGGKSTYVMPLVFSGAPVVNTFTTVWRHGEATALHPLFYSGLTLLIAGAVMALIFTPWRKSRPGRRRSKTGRKEQAVANEDAVLPPAETPAENP